MAVVYYWCSLPLLTEQPLRFSYELITKPQPLISISSGASLSSSISQLRLGCSSRTSSSSSSYVKCYCVEEKYSARVSHDDDDDDKGFSVLESDIPWDSGSIWSSFAFYLFSFHVPLGYGGLSMVANVLHQPILEPQTKAVSLLAIQILDLGSVIWVLSSAVKPQYDPFRFFQVKNRSKARNWLLASALGFGFLIFLVFLASVLADQLPGTKPTEASNQMVKEILSSGAISKTSCILAYCIVTPLLEEIIYRGILITSLTSQMKWYQAVILSSAVFSAVHFSGENFLQLFVIGSVLGCSYHWTGNLRSSFAIHSLYNTLILIITYLS